MNLTHQQITQLAARSMELYNAGSKLTYDMKQERKLHMADKAKHDACVKDLSRADQAKHLTEFNKLWVQSGRSFV